MKSINLMKNVGRFTPPKSPSLICPQIVCMIYPPKIAKAKSDLPSNRLYNLPSNRLYDLPPPEIAKSDLPSNRLYNSPSNRLYDLPPGGVNRTDDLRVNRTW